MNFRLLRRAALAILAVLPLTALAAFAGRDAGSDAFDALLRTGFKDVRENTSLAVPPAPPAQTLSAAPGGVFLHSSLDGRLAYCSASGCHLLLDGGAGVVVPAGPGALYFTGESGTGYCAGSSCAVLLPGVRVTFALTAGPNGDIYGSDGNWGWHCTPDSCRRASALPHQRDLNFVEGVYKPNGDFVASGAAGTFWCTNGTCARVGGHDMLFIDDRCAGNAPARVAYGFTVGEIYRCTPAGCRDLGVDHDVDNFAECAFDEQGRLLLPMRDGRGRREISSIRAAQAPAAPARSSEFFIAGADGATYRLANPAVKGAPSAGAPDRLPASVSREGSGRAAVLKLDAPVACWQWTEGDDGEEASAWTNECRVLR